MRKSVEHSSLLNIKVRQNLEHSNFSQIQEQTVQHFWGDGAPECRTFITYFPEVLLLHCLFNDF